MNYIRNLTRKRHNDPVVDHNLKDDYLFLDYVYLVKFVYGPYLRIDKLSKTKLKLHNELENDENGIYIYILYGDCIYGPFQKQTNGELEKCQAFSLKNLTAPPILRKHIVFDIIKVKYLTFDENYIILKQSTSFGEIVNYKTYNSDLLVSLQNIIVKPQLLTKENKIMNDEFLNDGINKNMYYKHSKVNNNWKQFEQQASDFKYVLKNKADIYIVVPRLYIVFYIFDKESVTQFSGVPSQYYITSKQFNFVLKRDINPNDYLLRTALKIETLQYYGKSPRYEYHKKHKIEATFPGNSYQVKDSKNRQYTILMFNNKKDLITYFGLQKRMKPIPLFINYFEIDHIAPILRPIHSRPQNAPITNDPIEIPQIKPILRQQNETQKNPITRQQNDSIETQINPMSQNNPIIRQQNIPISSHIINSRLDPSPKRNKKTMKNSKSQIDIGIRTPMLVTNKIRDSTIEQDPVAIQETPHDPVSTDNVQKVNINNNNNNNQLKVPVNPQYVKFDGNPKYVKFDGNIGNFRLVPKTTIRLNGGKNRTKKNKYRKTKKNKRLK